MPQKVELRLVEEKDEGCRLDRWFSRYYPSLSHAQLQKMIRLKDIRLNGKRTTANAHLEQGDEIRIPPFQEKEEKGSSHTLTPKEVDFIQSLIVYQDKDILALNKPAGWAVQGGTKVSHHIDGLLDGLAMNAERPRLVHRLDKETSGILLLARNAKTAAYLTNAFKTKNIQKTYYAVVQGKPKEMSGKVTAPLLKKKVAKGEELVCVDFDEGLPSESVYEVLDTNGDVSFLALQPHTGRTHQLRVHCAYLGMPIIGDVKYGDTLFLEQFPKLEKKMYLHAYQIVLPLQSGKILKIKADIPKYMKNCLDFFGFSAKKK